MGNAYFYIHQRCPAILNNLAREIYQCCQCGMGVRRERVRREQVRRGEKRKPEQEKTRDERKEKLRGLVVRQKATVLAINVVSITRIQSKFVVRK